MADAAEVAKVEKNERADTRAISKLSEATIPWLVQITPAKNKHLYTT
jgi:hypothetical protein